MYLATHGLVAQTVARAEVRIGRMMGETAARRVEPAGFYLTTHILGRSKLQPALGRQCAYLVLILVGVATRALRDINYGKSAERFYRYTLATLCELVAQFVEYGGKHLLDCRPADSASLNNG